MRHYTDDRGRVQTQLTRSTDYPLATILEEPTFDWKLLRELFWELFPALWRVSFCMIVLWALLVCKF